MRKTFLSLATAVLLILGLTGYGGYPGGPMDGPSLMQYGAVCDGSHDDAAAFLAANAAVPSFFIPPGVTCVVKSSIYLTAGIWSGAGGATIKFPNDLGLGTAGIVYEGPGITNINLTGPNVSFTKGVAPSQMTGIQFGRTAGTASQPKLDHMTIQGFRNGIEVLTNYGHWWVTNSTITNNYYGLYLTSTGGDAKITDDTITGNSKAQIACTYNGACFAGGATIRDTHLGNGPYGIYREPGTDFQNPFGGFITRAILDNVGFECIGNAAIADYNAVNVTGTEDTEELYIRAPGFSWDNGSLCPDPSLIYELNSTGSFTATTSTSTNPNVLTNVSSISGVDVGQAISGSGIPANTWVLAVSGTTVTMSQNATASASGVSITTTYNPQKYALDFADLNGITSIEQGPGAFLPGTSGAIIHTQQCANGGGAGGSVHLRYTGDSGPPQAASQGPLYIVDNDNSTGCLGASTIYAATSETQPGGNPFRTLTIASGTSSVSYTETLDNFAMTCGGLTFQATPTVDPNTTSPDPIWVTTACGSGATANQVTVTVHAHSNVSQNTPVVLRIN